MEVLKLIFCSTTYETLLTAFPIIFNNLVDNVSEKLLQTDEKVVNFADDKWFRSTVQVFKSTLPKECLRECASSCTSEYKKELIQLFKIILPHLAAGFSE